MNIPYLKFQIPTLGLCAGMALAAAMLLQGAAQAQPQRGGFGQVPPERVEAAWALQAQGVAADLGLNEEQAEKLKAAYKSSRESQREATRAAMAGAGGGAGAGRGAEVLNQLREINDKERAKLKAELAGFLDEAQAGKALASLGTYQRQWDRLVDATAALKLEEDKQQQALKAINDYVIDVDKQQQAAIASGDMQGLREAGREAREALDSAMGKVLSPEQLSQWQEATTMQRGAPGGGPGGRAPGGGGGGAQRDRERQQERDGGAGGSV